MTRHINILAWTMVVAAVFMTAGCGPTSGFATKPGFADDRNSAGEGDPTVPGPPYQPPPQQPGPDHPSEPQYKVESAPIWESASRPQARNWTLHAFAIVDKYGQALVRGSSDIKDFCPEYFTLTRNQKLNFWVSLIAAMTKYESSFNPTTRMHETTMGTDPITKLPVHSEGLLQLSYQDVQAYPFCNEFDWNADKHLDPKDPRKTILDPFKNLTCGIRILNWQNNKYDQITVNKGQYWAVLKTGGKYQKIAEISGHTKAIPFCK